VVKNEPSPVDWRLELIYLVIDKKTASTHNTRRIANSVPSQHWEGPLNTFTYWQFCVAWFLPKIIFYNQRYLTFPVISGKFVSKFNKLNCHVKLSFSYRLIDV